jgi:hypothetical protein
VVSFETDEPANMFGLAVFDLAAGTGAILHPHELPGMDGYPPEAIWRPNGEWLIYNAFDADFSRGGLWLLRTDGATELHLGAGAATVWRPDGGGLVYLDPSSGTVRFFDLISLESTDLAIGGNLAQPVAWFAP